MATEQNSREIDYTEAAKYIESVGVELECIEPNTVKTTILKNSFARIKESIGRSFFSGYMNAPIDLVDLEDGYIRKLDERYSNSEDGSISISGDCDSPDDYRTVEHTYYDYTANALSDLKAFLKFFYLKRRVETNDSCGFHIHMRFKDKEFYKVFSFKKYNNLFMKDYVNEFKRYGLDSKYMRRLRNSYCKPGYWLNNVLRSYKEHGFFASGDNSGYDTLGGIRTHAINYLSLLEEHNTIEFRIMPYQDSFSEAVRSLEWLVGDVFKLLKRYEDSETMLVSDKVKVEKPYTIEIAGVEEGEDKIFIDKAELTDIEDLYEKPYAAERVFEGYTVNPFDFKYMQLRGKK